MTICVADYTSDLAAKLKIDSRPGKGTRVDVTARVTSKLALHTILSGTWKWFLERP